jgi:hypothetical protein
MKNVIYIAVIFLMVSFEGFSQTCTSASNDSNYTFFTNCETGSSFSYTGNYTIDVKNGTTLKINGNITITGTLTINLQSNSGLVEILNGFTLTATNVTFSGNPNPKSLIVDGPSGKLAVNGQLDFGGRDIDIDGTGTISAVTVVGGGLTTCSSDGSCPVFTVTGSCTGGGICSGQGLPITLSSFSAGASDNGIGLKWVTNSELNFDYFSVERSSNGKEFSELTQVQGNGNTTEIHNYSYEDTRPFFGKNYYRLKSIDFDGYSEYFNTISFNYLGEKQFDVSPNPSNGKGVSFILNFPVENESTVTVFDNLGVVMGSYDISNERSISFQNTLRSGIYYAKLSSPSLSKVARFVVKE